MTDHATIPTARYPRLAAFVKDRAIRFGTFTLTSGRTSNVYCDGKQVSFSGEGAHLLADAILAELDGLEFDALGGMDMGATPIVAAVTLLAYTRGREIPTFVVRKAAREHGTRRAMEGLAPETPSRVVLVDDTITTGGSILKAIDVVREAGHTVVRALAMLDRGAGGREAIEAAGVEYTPLVTFEEIGVEAG